MTFSCRRAAELVSASMDRRLIAKERFTLRVHLVICGMCRMYQRQLRVIRRLLRDQMSAQLRVDNAAAMSLSAEARQRIGRGIAEGGYEGRTLP